MSESDTMFNERDRRCPTVQLMPSSDPSYDNRTIASNLKMQIWIATNNRDVPRVIKTKFPAMVMVFGVVSSDCHIMPPHIVGVGLKVHTKVYLDVLNSVVIPWCNHVTGVAVGLVAGPQVQRDPGLASGVLQLCTLLSLPPSPTWTRWTTSFGHTSRTSPTWPPKKPKPAWSPPSAEYSSSLWKRHAPSSGSVSRRWLRGKVATLNRCQLYYIIKLPDLIFSIKVLNKSVELFSFGRQFYRSTLYTYTCVCVCVCEYIYIYIYIYIYQFIGSYINLWIYKKSVQGTHMNKLFIIIFEMKFQRFLLIGWSILISEFIYLIIASTLFRSTWISPSMISVAGILQRCTATKENFLLLYL